MPMYHEGNRELQDRFGARLLADRLVERLWRDRFKDEDKAFIETVGHFFLATADAGGHPDCSFKGGPPGFVKIPAPDLLVFPDYDGNGMFKSLGNIKVNPQVGLLFMTMGEKPQRLRVNGRASLHFDDPMSLLQNASQRIARDVMLTLRAHPCLCISRFDASASLISTHLRRRRPAARLW